MDSRWYSSQLSIARAFFAQVHSFIAEFINDLQHSELFMKRRSLWAVLFVVIYVAFVFVGPSPLATGFSPDTASYLQLSPYRREPMYGVWANGIHALFGSWRIVEMLQVGAFLSFSAWVIVELTLISNLGPLSALLFVAMLLVLTRLGLLNLVGSLISEGLFYPMIMLMVAMLLAWLRTRSTSFLVGLMLILVGMTQLRTAALLVLGVPILAAICVMAWQPRISPVDLQFWFSPP